jgi:hypothetical protein
MHVAFGAAAALNPVSRMPWTQTFGSLATKLLRTYQGQMEALAKRRRSVEQVVWYIHVDNRDGEAVITDNVQIRGRENGKVDDQSYAT